MVLFSPVARAAAFPGGLIRSALSWVGSLLMASLLGEYALPVPGVQYEGQCEAWGLTLAVSVKPLALSPRHLGEMHTQDIILDSRSAGQFYYKL